MKDIFVEVAIVGAGISGLSCARLFTQHGFSDYAIFEASDRVGGRTQVDADGTDLGGAYIGPTQDRILSIIDELKLKLRKTNTKGKTVQYLNGKISHYHGTIPPVSILGALDLNSAMIQIDKLANEMNLAQPHLSLNAGWLDKMTGEELLSRYTWTTEAQAVLRTGIRAILCVEPCQLSALYLVWYIGQSGGVKRIFETENGAQDSKLVEGAGRIAELMAEKYCVPIKMDGSNRKKRRLYFNMPIRAVDTTASSGSKSSNGNECFVKLTSGTATIYANYVVLAIPPVQILRIHYTPFLDAQRYQSLQRWPMGCIIKTFVYYDKAFWVDEGYNGSIVCDDGIVLVSYDDTKLDGSDPCIMGFVLSTSSLLKLTSEERKIRICDHYSTVFQTDKARVHHCLRYKEKCWAEEQWVGGCYVGAVGPGVLGACGREHCRVLNGRVFMAGTEAANLMIGYMDGAVEAGERIGRNVLVKLGYIDEHNTDITSFPPESVQMPWTELKITAFEHAMPSVVTAVGVVLIVLLVALWQLSGLL